MGNRVLGVLSGGDTDDTQLAAWSASADVLIAADGGGNRLVALGFRPIVVGDLDSFDMTLASRVEAVHEDPRQDRTDFDKLLEFVHDKGYRSLTVIGLEGDHLDHVLAGLSSVVRSPLDVRIVLRQAVGHVLREGQDLTYDEEPGQRVSLLPLTKCEGVSISGVKWPLQGVEMEPGGFLSVSNVATGPVHASVESGTALLILGRRPSDLASW
ncbi:MAG: thiamine diphosphokinase [Armatimonadetes bacterium]|nr:thiamine diphosphokinase [Armatimonadota bacterium]